MTANVKVLLTVVFLVLAGASLPNPVLAEDYYCEVMSLNGQAQVTYAGETAAEELKEGDLLSVGDKLAVAKNSSVDLAFDKDWNNVTRLAQGTEMEILSIYPTGLAMSKGDVFARLQKLPRNSTFEIQTPTCVAAVRGSAYRTIHENGESRVLNYASSPVEVFGLDSAGRLLDSPVILRGEEKTEISALGEAPRAPEKMTTNEVEEARSFRDGVRDEIKVAGDEGRVSSLQDIEAVDRDYQTKFTEKLDALKKGDRDDVREDESASGPAADRISKKNENASQRTDELSEKSERIADKAENVSEKADKISENADKIAQNGEKFSDKAEKMAEKAEKMTERAEKLAEKAEKIAEKAEKLAEKVEKEVSEKVDKERDRKEDKKRKDENEGGGRRKNNTDND